MTKEQVLVLIKPDAMVKNLYGLVLDSLTQSGLTLVGAKLVQTKKEVIEKHYEVHRGKPFYDKLVDHLLGKYHVNEVFAMVYSGENAIKRMREFAGETHPEKAKPTSLRGRFGRVHTTTDVFENVVHVSDAPETAEQEIKLWFSPDELTETMYKTKKSKVDRMVWA